jgi:hypothetical protein
MARHPQSDQVAILPSEILSDGDSSLGGVLQHASLLLKLQKLLAASIDASLAGHFQVANVRQNRLILVAPSAAWATRLRLEAPHLLRILNRAGYANLRDLDIRVAPLFEQPASVRGEKPLSAAAEQALDCMARLGTKREE